MKTAEAIYDEMADQFAQETGMELAGAGEMAVRLRALAAQVYGLYLESAWTRKQCFPRPPPGRIWTGTPFSGASPGCRPAGRRGPCGFPSRQRGRRTCPSPRGRCV